MRYAMQRLQIEHCAPNPRWQLPYRLVRYRGCVTTKSSSGLVGRPKTFDRDHVIDVAVATYWSEGVHAISLNELCRRADVSKPGMYREFDGEDGLMDAALERYAESVLAPNLAKLTPDLTFADGLAGLIALMTDAERAGPAGCLLVKMQHSPDRLGPKVAARVDALRDGARAAYGEWIDQSKQLGQVAPNVSTEVAAALIDIQCTTLLIRMALGEDPRLLRSQATLAFVGLTAQT